MLTLDQQIQRALQNGGEDPQEEVRSTFHERKAPPQVTEAEKIATALEFIGRRGVRNMVKEASHTAASGPPPGTNDGVDHGSHRQKTVGPHAGAPPMSPKDVGAADDNGGSHPGGSGEQAKPRGTGQTHHPALASSRSAIDFDKREKAKQVVEDLSSLFDAKPFSDGKLKENLTGAAEKGDKNIRVKTASDRALLLAAIQKKARMEAHGQES